MFVKLRKQATTKKLHTRDSKGLLRCPAATLVYGVQPEEKRPMLSRAARQGSHRAAPCAWAQVGAVAIRTRSSCASSGSVAPAASIKSMLKQHQHAFFMSTMMCPTRSSTTRHASSSKIVPAVQLEQTTRASSSCSSRHALPLVRPRADCSSILSESCVRARGFRTIAGQPSPPMFRRAGHRTAHRCANERRDCQQQGGAPVSLVRAMGGQSVVPWELALFLVEEMKGEGVEPGDVVYTAALAECRWAGQTRHVEYLLQQMEAEGMTIVPGIPGATDDLLPPSQAPTLFEKAPETTTSNNSRDISGTPHHHQSMAPEESQDNNASLVIAAATSAARTADIALATMEAMWATEEHEPSPATCRAALDACAVGGQWDRALSLVRDSAMAMASDDDDGDGADAADGVGATGNPGGVREGSVSINRGVEGLALEGRWNDAFLLVQQRDTE